VLTNAFLTGDSAKMRADFSKGRPLLRLLFPTTSPAPDDA